MKMLYDKENGIADKFLAYNKLLFNDNITTLSFYKNPEYAIDVVFNHDYEEIRYSPQRSIDFSKKTTNILFIGIILKKCCSIITEKRLSP